MSDAYRQLLDATIQQLEEMKSKGARFVAVSPDTLEGLSASRSPKPSVPVPQQSGLSPESSHSPAPAKAIAPAVPTPTTTPPAKKSAAPHPAHHKSSAAAEPSPALDLPGMASPQSATTVRPELSPEAKAAAFAELRERALACVKCPHLAASRKNVVFGVGDINSPLMFVGEAPGEDEDIQGEPFVGKAGQLLTKIIQAMGLARQSVYIGNILKCRPDTPGQTSGNRKPKPEEMDTCIPYLHEQIDLIRPRVIVALGATSVEGLLGKTIGITRLRGQWKTYRGIPLMPTYHPAYLLRNQAMSEKRKVWEDMMQVMEKLEMSISEKQKNFFLK
jgi:DNA polymerase